MFLLIAEVLVSSNGALRGDLHRFGDRAPISRLKSAVERIPVQDGNLLCVPS